LALDGGDGDTAVKLDAMSTDLGGDVLGRLGVQGPGHHLLESLQHADPQSPSHQGFGHLQADVSGPDDERGADLGPIERPSQA